MLQSRLNHGLTVAFPPRGLPRYAHSAYWISNLISCLEKRKLECLGRYQTRGPVSLERLGIAPGSNESKGQLSYEEAPEPENSKVILVGEKVIKKHGGNRREWDPLSFIADLTCHVPDFRNKMTIYYGHYSNKKRGQRKKAANKEGVEVIIKASEEQSTLPKSHWARMTKKIYEVDPLECPKCQSEMRIIACIDQPDVIYKILSHLGLLGQDYDSDVILQMVRWYCCYALSYRDLVEMAEERGLSFSNTTIMRWVHEYAPEIDKRTRPHLKRTGKSWRVDETYVKVKGKWTYLYRAVDKEGKTLDFLLCARRDTKAAMRFFRKTLGACHTQTPRVINVDKNAALSKSIENLKDAYDLPQKPLCRQVKYRNNIVEQDHRHIKRIIKPGLGFQSCRTASKTICGIEIMHMIGKD